MQNERFQCRHIFTEGRRCKAPTLTGQQLCYFHQTNRPKARQRHQHPQAFTLPRPEDRAAIQLAIGDIIDRLCAYELDTKRAGLLLYALQIASANLPKAADLDETQVEEVTTDETLGILAPEAAYQEPTDSTFRDPANRGRSFEEILLEEWHDQCEAQQPIETIQAVAFTAKPSKTPRSGRRPPSGRTCLCLMINNVKYPHEPGRNPSRPARRLPRRLALLRPSPPRPARLPHPRPR